MKKNDLTGKVKFELSCLPALLRGRRRVIMPMALTTIFCFVVNFLITACAQSQDFSWQDCVQQAAKNQPDLIAAYQEVKVSQAAKTIVSSGLFPQVDSSVSALRQKSGSSYFSGVRNTIGYEVTGSQLLFDGSKTLNFVRSARQAIQGSQSNYQFVSSQVRYRLRNAFVNLLYSQSLLDIAKQILDIRKSNLELIKLRYESGLDHKGALLTAQADVAQAEFDVIQASRSIETNQHAMLKEMGQDTFFPIQIKGGFGFALSKDYQPRFDAIVETHPSLKQQIAQKNMAYYEVESAYGTFWPQVTAQTGVGKTGRHWAPDQTEWNLGATLSLPLFEGGSRIGQVNQAKARLTKQKENERSVRQSLRVSLYQAWQGLLDAKDMVKIKQQYLVAAH